MTVQKSKKNLKGKKSSIFVCWMECNEPKDRMIKVCEICLLFINRDKVRNFLNFVPNSINFLNNLCTSFNDQVELIRETYFGLTQKSLFWFLIVPDKYCKGIAEIISTSRHSFCKSFFLLTFCCIASFFRLLRNIILKFQRDSTNVQNLDSLILVKFLVFSSKLWLWVFDSFFLYLFIFLY